MSQHYKDPLTFRTWSICGIAIFFSGSLRCLWMKSIQIGSGVNFHNSFCSRSSPTPLTLLFCATSNIHFGRKSSETFKFFSTFDVINLHYSREKRSRSRRKEGSYRPWLIGNINCCIQWKFHFQKDSLSLFYSIIVCTRLAFCKLTVCNKKCKLISWEKLSIFLFLSPSSRELLDRHFINRRKFLSKALLNNFIVRRHRQTIPGKRLPKNRTE